MTGGLQERFAKFLSHNDDWLTRPPDPSISDLYSGLPGQNLTSKFYVLSCVNIFTHKEFPTTETRYVYYGRETTDLTLL